MLRLSIRMCFIGLRVIVSMDIVLGYFGSWIKREPRVEDSELIAFLRRKNFKVSCLCAAAEGETSKVRNLG
jgi:hypothetical protein